jgi:hypothetical protein
MPPWHVCGYPFTPSPRSTMVTISLYGKSSSASSVGLSVRHARIVRSVARVSAKNESSPEAFGSRDPVVARVHFGSLMRTAAQGEDIRRFSSAPSMMRCAFWRGGGCFWGVHGGDGSALWRKLKAAEVRRADQMPSSHEPCTTTTHRSRTPQNTMLA